ncbi:MAG: pirin family protein [Chitinophagaceae bacterium]
MANTILHKATDRGHADFGWLNSYHSFSFGHYYNPGKMGFGLLRVLNDDVVRGGTGFGKHPHDNMEIISIPLEGDLQHQDSIGNVATIRQGDIQVMSAGTGVQHSEHNKKHDQEVKFLQIWIYPNKMNVAPRYDQKPIDQGQNELKQILSPNPDSEGVWVYQDAWMHWGNFEEGAGTDYAFHKTGNGVYAFVLEGAFEVEGQQLGRRDALGVWETDKLTLKATAPGSRILLIEVPMEMNA